LVENYYFDEWQNRGKIVVLKTIKLLKWPWRNYCIASVFFWCDYCDEHAGTQSWSPFTSERQRQKRKSYKYAHMLKDRGSVISFQMQSRWHAVETNWSWLKSNKVRRGSRLQHRGTAQGRKEIRQHVVAQHLGGREVRLAQIGGVEFENRRRPRVMKWGVEQGLGVIAVRWLLGCKVKAQGRVCCLPLPPWNCDVFLLCVSMKRLPANIWSFGNFCFILSIFL